MKASFSGVQHEQTTPSEPFTDFQGQRVMPALKVDKTLADHGDEFAFGGFALIKKIRR